MGKVNGIVSCVVSVAVFLFGLFMATSPLSSLVILIYIARLLLLAFAAVSFIDLAVNRYNDKKLLCETLVRGVLSAVGGVMLFVFPQTTGNVLQIAFAVLFGVDGGISLLVGLVNLRMRTTVAFGILSTLWGIFNVALCIFVAVTAEGWLLYLTTVVAAYCILFGLAGIIRMVLIHRRSNRKGLYVPLPVWAEIDLSTRAMKWVKQSILNGSFVEEELRTEETIDEYPEGLEVMVLLSDAPSQAMGHVDICIDGQVYSYGNYDHSRENIHFFGLLWDGVVTVCERHRHLQFCVETTRKVVLSYRIAINDEDKKTVRENIHRLLQGCERWIPPRSRENSYVNALVRIGAEIYKITKGRYKTYFVLDTNCASLAYTVFAGTSYRIREGWFRLASPGTLISACEYARERSGKALTRQVYVGNRMVKMLRGEEEPTGQALGEL